MSCVARRSRSRMPVKPDPLISDMQIIGKALRSKSKSDKSSERTSTKTSRISIRENSTASSHTKSRAKSLPSSPIDSKIDPRSPSLVIPCEKPTDINAKTEEPKVSPTEEERCPICLDDYTNPKQLDKCGHRFCTDCIDTYFRSVKPQCPCCFTIYGEIRGNQPEDGDMNVKIISQRLPGYGRNSKGTIQITYMFPDGTQDERHPNPDVPYYGTVREAFLPDNAEGQEVLRLLQRSFELRQTFTVGQSRTTGCDNVVTWNDIHHKTSFTGGMENFGYPDPTYLNRVRQELAAKGIK